MHPQHPFSEQSAPTHVADFSVIASLGRSGAYVVAAAPERLRSDAEEVVLNVMPTEDSDGFALRELSAVLRRFAAVRSPHLLRLLEVGRNDGLLYYAAECLPGASLSRPNEQLTFAEVLRSVSHAARGAHELHEHGFAHGDIDPGSVLLHPQGAQLAAPSIDAVLRTIGYPAAQGTRKLSFIDPEVLRGAKPSRASDLYSLGATLHQVASGHSLYPAVDEHDPHAATATITSTPPTVADGLPGPIEQIVRLCIDAHRRGDRPKTAGDLADRLDALWKQ